MKWKRKVKRFVTMESENSWKLLFYPGRWILLILTLVPTIYALYLSFFNYNLAKANRREFVFLDNFVKVLKDGRVWSAFSVTDCNLYDEKDRRKGVSSNYYYSSHDHDSCGCRPDLENVL